MQSSLPSDVGLHVAIIMDGNGRWATARGLPRSAGHRAGVEAVRRVVESAPHLGIGMLTLFAFSADNWRRPAEEVTALFTLLRLYLRRETRRLADRGARLSVIGRRDRLPAGFAAEIDQAERATSGGTKLHLRVALDYSGRAAIADAATRLGGGAPPSPARFGRLIARSRDDGCAEDDDRAEAVDLLIRTGGEKRLSDFLLWECAYAELCFTEVMWPDFAAADLAAALAEFRRRERRFGGLAPLVAAGVLPGE
jgi:undecaprenyl diphosphate synthase